MTKGGSGTTDGEAALCTKGLSSPEPPARWHHRSSRRMKTSLIAHVKSYIDEHSDEEPEGIIRCPGEG